MIGRYEPADGATINRELSRLQSQYEVAGNVHELVSSGTLTADTAQVEISLNNLSWSWLHLHAVMQLNKNVFAGLRANFDPSLRYHARVFQPASSVFASGKSVSAALGLFGDTGQVGMIDLWIFLTPMGFTFSGYGSVFRGSGFVLDVPTQEWNWASSDLDMHQYAGFYRGGPVTSLQLVVPNEQTLSPVPINPVFEAGGYWLLEGIRA